MKASDIVRRVMQNVSGKGIIARVDIDRVDVIPFGSRAALKKVKLSGDASAVTIGDEVSLINVQGETIAISSNTFEEVPVSESTQDEEFAPKDHNHENIDAGMLDGKHSDRFVQINEDGLAMITGDLSMNGVLGSTFNRYRGEIGSPVDLNTYITTGRWHQSENAQAETGTNYPIPLAGMLCVYADLDNWFIYQTYQIYTGGEMYFRARYIDTWSPWRRIWHDANLAPGSGGDADTLDGYHATALPSHDILPQDGGAEGGQITLKGAGSNKDVIIDNYASTIRIITIDTGYGYHIPIQIDNNPTPRIDLNGDILLYDRLNGQTPGASTTVLYSRDGLPMTVNPGNVITPAFVSRLVIPVLQGYFVGAAIVNVATNTKGVALRDGQVDIIYFNLSIPAGWGGKNAVVNLWWSPSTTHTGNALLVFEKRHITHGVNLPVGSSGSGSATVAAPGIADRVVKTSINVSTMGIEGQALQAVIYRHGSNAADTFTGSVNILAAELLLY